MDKKMRDSDLVLPENFHKTERCQKGLKSESIISRNSFLLNTRGFSLSFKASSFIFVKSALNLMTGLISLILFKCHFNWRTEFFQNELNRHFAAKNTIRNLAFETSKLYAPEFPHLKISYIF